MSRVTTVLVFVRHCTAHDPLHEALTAPIASDTRSQHLGRISDAGAGGNKGFEGAIYGAGLNWVDVDEVDTHLSQIPWTSPAVAVISFEHDDQPIIKRYGP